MIKTRTRQYNYSIGYCKKETRHFCKKFVKKSTKKVAYTTISNDKKQGKVLEKVHKKAHIPLPEALFCAAYTGGYTHALLAWIADNKLELWLESVLTIKKSSGLRRGKSDKADAESMASYAYNNHVVATYGWCLEMLLGS